MGQDDFYSRAKKLHGKMKKLIKAIPETDRELINLLTQLSDTIDKMQSGEYDKVETLALYDKQIELLREMIKSVRKQKENQKEFYAVKEEMSKLKLINDVDETLDKD